MPRDSDAVLLESVSTRRARLRSAFLHGDMVGRRTTSDNVRRFIGSIVLAAVACAGCAGYSFVKANAGSMRGGSQGTTVQTPSPEPSSPMTTDGPGPADVPDASAQSGSTKGATP